MGVSAIPPRAVQFGQAAMPAVAVVAGVLCVLIVSRGDSQPRTYASASWAATSLDLLAGLSLIAAGVVAWASGPNRWMGILAMVGGVAWFAPDWIGWAAGPPILRTLGLVTAPLLLPTLAHVAREATGRNPPRAASAGVVVAYVIVGGLDVARLVVYDPFTDPYCWSNCTDNLIVLQGNADFAQWLGRLALAVECVVGIVLAGWALLHLTRLRAPARRIQLPILGPAVAVGVAFGGYAAFRIAQPHESAADRTFQALFAARAIAVTALAAGTLWHVAKARLTMAAVHRLAADLDVAGRPGSLRAALARALGDGSLDVGYWLSDSSRYVDPQGLTMDLAAVGRGRTVTPIVRHGEPVAVVIHHPGLLEGRELEREIGAAARLAVDNERLQAAILAQVEHLRASRSRIVEAGDSERRRLERNLHDGAQQRLLAVTYEIRLARARAADDGDKALADMLGRAEAEAVGALEELRVLAHGIYPAILTEAGLSQALATLADGAPIPVELDIRAGNGCSSPAEAAAYQLVAEAVADGERASATFVAVRVQREAAMLQLTVLDDGRGPIEAIVRMGDRIGAAGGSLTSETRPAGGRTITAELPCA